MLQTIKDIIATIKNRDELWLAAVFVQSIRGSVKKNKRKDKKGPHYLYNKIGQDTVKSLEYLDMYNAD